MTAVDQRASSTRVGIVTLNWNGERDTLACVRAVLASTHQNFFMVVCDNASRPDSWTGLLSLRDELGNEFAAHASLEEALANPLRPRVVLIQTGANLGYAGGINVGLRYALTDPEMAYCWILNNDTEVAPTALSEGLRRCAQDPTIGICGATLLLADARHRVQALGGSSYEPWRARSAAIGFNATVDAVPADPAEVERRLGYVNGAAMLVSRRYLETVGLMDERYFLYSEEHDWAERGRGRFRLGYAPRAVVYHRHGASIGTAASGGSALSLFYIYRNKLAFARRYHPQWLPTARATLAWEAFKYLLKGQRVKARAAFMGLRAEPCMRSHVEAGL